MPRPKKTPPTDGILRGKGLELFDAKGRLRIWMWAGGEVEDDTAMIKLYSTGMRCIELAAMGDRQMTISIKEANGKGGGVTIAMSEEDCGGISIFTKDGEPGVVLGQLPDSLDHHLLLFSEGRPIFATPRNSATARKKGNTSEGSKGERKSAQSQTTETEAKLKRKKQGTRVH